MVIIKSSGMLTWKDKNGRMQTKEGTVYVHFNEKCLKGYFEDFDYSKLEVKGETLKGMSDNAKHYLRSFGIKMDDV